MMPKCHVGQLQTVLDPSEWIVDPMSDPRGPPFPTIEFSSEPQRRISTIEGIRVLNRAGRLTNMFSRSSFWSSGSCLAVGVKGASCSMDIL